MIKYILTSLFICVGTVGLAQTPEQLCKPVAATLEAIAILRDKGYPPEQVIIAQINTGVSPDLAVSNTKLVYTTLYKLSPKAISFKAMEVCTKSLT